MVMGLLLLTLGGVIGITLWVTQSQKADSLVINIAGRQRMLSQKYTKEFYKEYYDYLNHRQLVDSARHLAGTASRQVNADRAQYQKVMRKVKGEVEGLTTCWNWQEVEGAAPLSVTFMREVSEDLKKTEGYGYDLLSKYNINKDRGLHDEFEREAWDHLVSNPAEPYTSLNQAEDGSVSLRYAIADVTKKKCATCHNNDPQSPKHDFVVGELMGILAVSVPITSDSGLASSLMQFDAESVESTLSAKTAELFKTTLVALENGGETYTDLDMTQTISIPMTTDTEITAKLREVGAAWEQLAQAVTQMKEVEPYTPEYFKAVETVGAMNLAVLKNMNQAVGMYQANSQAKTAFLTRTEYASALLACLVFVGSLFLVNLSVIRPLNRMVEMVKSIASGGGDLTQRLDDTSKSEIGQLAKGFNVFVENLHGIISDVRRATGEVAAAATEIAANSEEMAAGMDEQTGQVMQVSTALEEMSSSIIEVANMCNQASSQAQDAGTSAENGGEIVNRTIGEIETISQQVNESAQSVTNLGRKSEQIGEIIEVINDIADQTNLLALNAAIEAARAGEHGRGFAVVADEVRKLAERTQHATEEVSRSITEIQQETQAAVERMDSGREQVKKGVDLSKEAGGALGQIVDGTQNVSREIGDIAAAADEQSSTAEEISRSVEQINAVMRQTAEGTSQSATAAVQLSHNAEQLQSIVMRFILD